MQNRAPMQRQIDGFDAPGHLPFAPRESSVVFEGPRITRTGRKPNPAVAAFAGFLNLAKTSLNGTEGQF